MLFAERIRQLRESYQMLQRQLAATLEIDTPIMVELNMVSSEQNENKLLNLLINSFKFGTEKKTLPSKHSK